MQATVPGIHTHVQLVLRDHYRADTAAAAAVAAVAAAAAAVAVAVAVDDDAHASTDNQS